MTVLNLALESGGAGSFISSFIYIYLCMDLEPYQISTIIEGMGLDQIWMCLNGGESVPQKLPRYIGSMILDTLYHGFETASCLSNYDINLLGRLIILSVASSVTTCRSLQPNGKNIVAVHPSPRMDILDNAYHIYF